jgi:hypothetical protein
MNQPVAQAATGIAARRRRGICARTGPGTPIAFDRTFDGTSDRLTA